MNQLIATCEIVIDAPVDRIWRALITPSAITAYMFGTTVRTDWKEGSPITWTGEWEGKPYEDKGRIVRFVPGQRLEYTHYSPLSGLPDEPASYHTVTIDLAVEGPKTRVSLSQDNNPTNQAREHSQKNWGTMLEGLKRYVED